jgi:hypothetical protein
MSNGAPAADPEGMLWLAWCVSLYLVWFENRWIVREPFTERPRWFTPNAQALFWVLRLAFTYGILLALGYVWGFTRALVAFAVYYLFANLSFRFFYRRAIREKTALYVQLMRESASQSAAPFDERAALHEAVMVATSLVHKSMKG